MKIKQNISKWPYIPDHPYRILIKGDSGSRKANTLLNLINNQPDNDKICLYAKDPYEAKYQYLINKHEKLGLKHFDGSIAFIQYSNDMHDVYKNIEEYNLRNKREILIVFDDMIAGMINNKSIKMEKVFKRKLNNLYIKWKGYDNSFNSWIDKKDIVQSESILS